MYESLSVGDIVRLAMNDRGVTYARLEELTGVPKSAIQRYVKGGTAKIPADRLGKICRALGLRPETLLRHGDPEWDVSASGEGLAGTPILGEIAAGSPIIATENILGYESETHPGCFYLRVRGDSMTGAGIRENDLVLIRIQSTAENGQIVACRLNGDEATLKRFRRAGDSVMLLPENPNYEPRLIPSADFENGDAEIIGIATEIKRKL